MAFGRFMMQNKHIMNTMYDFLDCLPFTVIVTDTDGVCMWQNEHAERSALTVQVGKHIAYIFACEQGLINSFYQVVKTGTSVRINLHESVHFNPENKKDVLFISRCQHRIILSVIDMPLHSTDIDSGYVHRLVSMLAHEIKNPLSGIRGASQLLDTGQEGGLASLITQETDRISSLVNDLENLSELKNITFGCVNIHQVLDSVVALAQNGFAKNCVIQKQYDPSLPSAWGDKDRLAQVFINLIKNACESMSDLDTQHITLTTSYVHGVYLYIKGVQYRTIRIDIKDRGCGIPDLEKRNIFAPYITHKTGGKGLGLSIVHGIVCSHGGRVSFDTSPQGTVFSIILPMENPNRTHKEIK